MEISAIGTMHIVVLEIGSGKGVFCRFFCFFIPWNGFPDYKMGRSYGALMIL